MTALLAALPLAVAIVAVLGGCTPAPSGPEPGQRSLLVLAAASLTDPFQEVGRQFEQGHPGVAVRFSFGPSDGLAAQIREGAPADVFASASPRWVEDVAARGPGVLMRAELARNRPVLVVPVDNPAAIRSLGDVVRPGVRLVLAAPGVPIGDYARQILENAGIAREALANLVSNEEDVKAVIQKVVLGEADVGIVYATDVTAQVADRVQVVDIPDPVNVVASYVVAVVASSDDPALARSFVSFLLGPGQAVLRRYGFLPPEDQP